MTANVPDDLPPELAAALDEGLKRYLAAAAAFDAPPAAPGAPVDWAAERARYRRLCAAFDRPRPDGLAVSDGRVEAGHGAIPVRWYRPPQARADALGVFFHGGGWAVGDLDTHDSVVADLAMASGVALVAVDYRLAPEAPYPAALEDAWRVLLAVAGTPGARRLVVVGDSAGGNLAAALALRCRDRGGPPLAGQVLIYPALATDPGLPAVSERANMPVLTAAAMRTFWEMYAGWPAPDAQAAPLLATDLRGVARAFLVACEWDPLRDDALAYAARLEEAGVAARLRHEAALVHGTLRARHWSPAAADSFAAIAAAIRDFADGRMPGPPDGAA